MPQLTASQYSPPDLRVVRDEEGERNLQALAEDRGLPLSLLEQVGIYVDFDKDPGHPIFIPYPNMSGVWYERQRRWIGDDSKPKYMSPKHSEAHLYNPTYQGPHSEYVYFCEGEFDTLSMVAIGRPAVGVAGANAFDRRWLELFRYCTIILAYDGDEYGREAELKLSQYIEPSNLKQLHVPDGADLNGMHKKGTLLPYVEQFEQREGV